jgi:hypothetical protein
LREIDFEGKKIETKPSKPPILGKISIPKAVPNIVLIQFTVSEPIVTLIIHPIRYPTKKARAGMINIIHNDKIMTVNI